MTFRQRNLLIVGGTSSLSYGLIKTAIEEKYNVFVTKRNLQQNQNGTNELLLNLESEDCVKNFKRQISEHSFDRIVFTIGALSGLQHGKTEQSLRKYIEIYVSNAIMILELCMDRMTNDSSLVFISSRSANNKSFDPYYSAAKAAVQSFLRSYTNYLPEKKKVFSVAPSLIENSTMYHLMDWSDHARHEILGNGTLMSLSEITSIIWNLGSDNLDYKSGDIVEFGNLQN